MSTAMSSFVDELKKIANTRYNKEIAAGNITRADLIPEASQTWAKHEFPSIVGAAQRKKTHEALRSYAPPTYDGNFTQEHANKLRSLQGANQIQHVDSYVPNTKGSLDVESLGQNPITIAMNDGTTIVHAPPISKDRRAGITSVVKSPIFKEDIDSFNHAVGQHEIGEASEFLKHRNSKTPVLQALGGHFGVEPILRENISLSKATPNARQFMTDVRALDKDDVLISKLVKQVGGTPNSPIPLDGRSHASLKRLVDKNVSNITPAARQKALVLAAQGFTSSYIPPDLLGIYDKKPGGSLLEKIKHYGDGILRHNKFVAKGL